MSDIRDSDDDEEWDDEQNLGMGVDDDGVYVPMTDAQFWIGTAIIIVSVAGLFAWGILFDLFERPTDFRDPVSLAFYLWPVAGAYGAGFIFGRARLALGVAVGFLVGLVALALLGEGLRAIGLMAEP